ncbi:MAG: DUF2878 domain-containing protein [Gammaproteobacteria bacterium]|nr:DUF2878 domain-containing protein [Gammaproteobacteria bacterium]
MSFILNVAAAQIGWFGSVIGGAQHMPWIGPLAALIALSIHFHFARRPVEELILIISCAAIGAVFDSALVAAGWVQYYSGQFNDLLAPYWIITMWMLFATTLNVSMRWLRGRWRLAALFGLFGGPMAYLGGQKLGGVILANEIAALLALGIGWAVMMPILLRLSETFDGISDSPSPARTVATEIRQ